MQQVKRTVWLMLSHSWVTVIAIGLVFCLFLFFQFLTFYANFPQEKAFKVTWMLNLVLSAFMGIYIGGAMQNLKQYYLWKINPGFRYTLIKSFLVIIAGLCLFTLPGLYFNLGDKSWLYLLIPYCVSLYASQLVLEVKFWLRFLIPVFPFGLVKLTDYGLPEEVSLLIIIVGALGLLFRMQMASHNRKIENAVRIRITINKTTSLQPSFVFKFNHYVSLLIESLILKPRADLSWAISFPHTRLALLSLIYVTIIGMFLTITSIEDKSLLEPFSIMFLVATILAIVLESRQLFSQLKSFAHIFSGSNHRQLKNTILRKLDFMVIRNTLAYGAGILILSLISPFPTDYLILYAGLVIVLIVAMVFLPLLLSVQWLNVSFLQVGLASLFGFSVFGALYWAKQYQETVSSPMGIAAIIIAAILTRLLTQFVFWQRPVEKLMVCK